MSFERKIASQSVAKEAGQSLDPTPERKVKVLEVAGATPALDIRGHEDRGQRIHHRLELSTHSHPTMRGTDLKPGRFARHVIRADGSLNLSFSKPPSVPEDQHHPQLGPRKRVWEIEVLVYFASATTVSWPSELKWGKSFAEQQLASGENALALAAEPGPRATDYPAASTAIFRFTYWEDVGDWYAEELLFGAEGSDPDAPEDPEDPPTEDPEDPEGPEDGTDPENPPDHEYTDPDTGDPLVPEAPEPAAGALVALHSGAISYSLDAGANWGVVDGPSSPYNMSPLKGQGIVVSTVGGEAWLSSGLTDFRRLTFTGEARSEIGLVNRDFETGDLTGWTHVSGDVPAVLGTVQPPQRGGQHYLSRDWSLESGGGFVIEQSFPAPTPGQRVEVAADILAENGDGTLEILGAATLPAINPGATWSGTKITAYATAPDGRQLDLELESGGTSGIGSFSNGNDTTKTFALKYTDGTLYDGAWALIIRDLDDHERVIFDTADFDKVIEGNGLLASVGSFAIVYTNTDNRSGAAILKSGRVTFEMELTLSAIGFEPTEVLADLVAESGPSFAPIDSTTWDAGEWGRRTVSGVVPENVDTLIVRLTAAGNTADVYFDNVTAEIVEERDESVSVVARDLAGRRHVVATKSSLHSVRDVESTYIAPVPFQPLFMAAHQGVVVIADGSQVGISTDAGLTFSTSALDGVSQVFSTPRRLAVLDNGEIREIETDGSTTLLHTADAGTHVAWDAKRQVWLMTGAGVAVKKTRDFVTIEDHSTMPQSATAGNGAGDRGVLALDVGRLIGWTPITRDLFHYDQDASTWKLSIPMKNAIQDIQEIK